MTSTLPRLRRRFVVILAVVLAAAAAVSWPDQACGTFRFVIGSFVHVAPTIGVGLIVSAWVAASGAGNVTATLFEAHPATMILLASAIGAVTPVCGVTVLPLMAGFLASGVPLAPIMAFWLSSPVTDPGLFAATWVVLGPTFAVAKTVAAFVLGVFAGAGTAAFAATDMVRKPLRLLAHVDGRPCCSLPAIGCTFRIWRESARTRAFLTELL